MWSRVPNCKGPIKNGFPILIYLVIEPLSITCFTCAKIFWRRKCNTIGTFVIQWDVNKWPCILWFCRLLHRLLLERNRAFTKFWVNCNLDVDTHNKLVIFWVKSTSPTASMVHQTYPPIAGVSAVTALIDSPNKNFVEEKINIEIRLWLLPIAGFQFLWLAAISAAPCWPFSYRKLRLVM